MSTKIGWCDETINPIVGCSRCSPGCEHCYAERMARRLAGMGFPAYEQVITENGKWNGKTIFRSLELDKIERWKKPRRVFICSMSDLFHYENSNLWILETIRKFINTRHTAILLTKRVLTMLCFQSKYFPCGFPDNIWCGVTVCNQTEADDTFRSFGILKAAVRFVSIEPMLGPVDIKQYLGHCNWVILGGETGPGARPVHPEWARSVRDQCVSAGVPFFFKGWGGHNNCKTIDGKTYEQFPASGR